MLKTGDRVLIHFPSNDSAVVRDMRRFHNTTSIVKSVKRLNTQMLVATLEGCVSQKGLPYTFVEDWLTPLDESEVAS